MGGSTFWVRTWVTGTRWICTVSSASSPASRPARSSADFFAPSVSVGAVPAAVVLLLAMAADLPTQFFGDLDGQVGDGRVLDAARLRNVDRPVADAPAGARGQQHHALGKPDRLTHVVRDEQDGD